MPHAMPDSNTVSSLLGRQRDALKRMLEILEQEYHALEINDLKQFDEAVGNKQLQTTALEGLDRELTQLFSAAADGHGRKTIESFIQGCADGPVKSRLQAVWDELLQTLQRCHEQNRINNRVVESSKIQIRQALDILRGDNAIPRLYSASGRENGHNPGNSLAIA
jgi:flagellar biosynthesis/type III secretory pathway chaperone